MRSSKKYPGGERRKAASRTGFMTPPPTRDVSERRQNLEATTFRANWHLSVFFLSSLSQVPQNAVILSHSHTRGCFAHVRTPTKLLSG